MIVSGAQQSNSVIYIHVSILPQTPLPWRPPHSIEQSSLCSTVGPCWLSILNVAVYTHWSQAPYPFLHAAAKSLQLGPTLCDPIDGSPPGSPVPGILQARTLEWVAISFSNAWKWKVKVKLLSCVQPHGLQPSRLLYPWDFPVCQSLSVL